MVSLTCQLHVSDIILSLLLFYSAVKAWLPCGYCAKLWIEQLGTHPQLGTLRYFLRQDT